MSSEAMSEPNETTKHIFLIYSQNNEILSFVAFLEIKL